MDPKQPVIKTFNNSISIVHSTVYILPQFLTLYYYGWTYICFEAVVIFCIRSGVRGQSLVQGIEKKKSCCSFSLILIKYLQDGGCSWRCWEGSVVMFAAGGTNHTNNVNKEAFDFLPLYLFNFFTTLMLFPRVCLYCTTQYTTTDYQVLRQEALDTEGRILSLSKSSYIRLLLL